jgi:pseudaminic acid cytidylyltransferase
MSRSVAIITARGGSKRIPRKNVKDFLGRPIIAYSISAARLAGCFDMVLVSTDDQEIAEVARKEGAAVPFLRSEATSDDHSTTADVLLEVIGELEKRGDHFEYGCCIYPTAPFITPDKLKRGYALLTETGADSVLPVVRFGYPIQRALKSENSRLSMFWPEHLNSRSQDLPAAFHDSGQFYWMNLKRFLITKRLFSDHTVALEIPESEVQDIDNEEDWKMAELKYRLIVDRRD